MLSPTESAYTTKKDKNFNGLNTSTGMPHVEITHNQHTGDSIVNGNVQQKNFGIFPFDYTADLWPHLQNDLLCVERDVTLYSLTHSLWPPKNNKKALLSQR